MKNENEIVCRANHISLFASLHKILLQRNQKHDDDDDLCLRQQRKNDEQQIFVIVREQNDEKFKTIACNQNQIVALFHIAKFNMRFKQSFENLLNDRSNLQFASNMLLKFFATTFDLRKIFIQNTIEKTFVIANDVRVIIELNDVSLSMRVNATKNCQHIVDHVLS